MAPTARRVVLSIDELKGRQGEATSGIWGSGAMLKRTGLVQACLLGAVVNGSALFAGNALAQYGCCQGGDATGANAWTEGNATSAQWPPNPPPPPAAIVTTLPVKAPPPVVAPVPYWWTHGEIEFGGRGFVNDPNQSGSKYGNTNPFNTTTGGYAYLGQKSLGKYYEYSAVAPGGFGGGHIATGTSDGLYQIDLWANNIASNFAGFSDQAYLLQASKAGEHYFWFNWDQTPHVYSTSALTPFLGVGSNNLIYPFTKSASASGMLPHLQPINLGIQRDTASAAYRWTPPDPSRPEGYAWDIRADYSHMDRTGTQVQGVSVSSPGGPAFQVPAPVDDTTQNFGVNGEYAGISPWGGKYSVKLAYNGSIYTDHFSSFTVQNPFTITGTPTPSTIDRLSTPPSNDAHGFSSVLAADLPASSRYVGTFNYTKMQQDDTFIPMSANPAPGISVFNVPWNQVNFGFINGNLANPTNSLHGDINTVLLNNVLTTRITPTLTSKLSYRYYAFDNETPRIVIPAWVAVDRNGGAFGNENSISSLSISYIKQNAGTELNWRPSPEWNFNLGGGWEHYDYTQTDVNATNEFSGKASVDWKPTVWLTARASGYYSDRRYDDYNYNKYVAGLQFTVPPGAPPPGFTQSNSSWYYSKAYRQFMFDNRQQTKANFAIDLVAFRGVTISPTLKYQEDYYGLNPLNQDGVSDQRTLSTGVDVGWAVDPNLSFVFTYYYETIGQWLYSNNSAGGGAAPPPGQDQVLTSDKQHVNTWTAGVNWSAIPDKLNFEVRYALSDGVDAQVCSRCTKSFFNGVTNVTVADGLFPSDTTLWQRLDATATYKFDPIWVRSMGFNGDLKARLRYTWERNAVNNWQNDPLAPFTSFVGTGTNFLWMAYDNPNYNVHVIAGSLIATW
jgi:MtrB/PioB family decaheme-associated outer membrane protein